MRRLLLVLLVLSVALAACRTECSRHGNRAVRELALKQSLFAIRQALDNFYRDHGRYPERLEEMRPRYILRIPDDPITGRGDWIPVTEGGGVTDIKSAAKGATCGGAPYSEL